MTSQPPERSESSQVGTVIAYPFSSSLFMPDPDVLKMAMNVLTGKDAAMNPHEAQKVVRRLAAAEGYLELGMATRAIAEIESVPEAGPFEAIAELLRGEALQLDLRYEEAIPALNRAAELFPKPFNQRALLSLSRCYRARGDLDLAEQMAAAAGPSEFGSDEAPDFSSNPIFHVQKANQRRPPAKG